jgi:hypothetical protein
MMRLPVPGRYCGRALREEPGKAPLDGSIFYLHSGRCQSLPDLNPPAPAAPGAPGGVLSIPFALPAVSMRLRGSYGLRRGGR